MTDVSEEAFVQLPCPICGRSEDSMLVAELRCGDRTSLESAFCQRCEHRYFRKQPSQAWYQRYYATEWDTGRLAPKGPATRLKGVLRRVPLARPAWHFIRRYGFGLRNMRAMQMFPLLLGVTQGDGAYYLPQPDVRKILEIGCGGGGLLEEFARSGFQAVGTEASQRRAQECRKRGLQVFNCPVDTFKPVESSAPYDLTYSTHVLEHIADPAAHVRQLAALVRDGGYVYLQVPHMTLGEFVFLQSHYAGHCQSFSPRSLALLLEANGLTPVRMQVDQNIQVLARRGAANGSAMSYRQTAHPEQLLELFRHLKGEEGRLLCIQWIREIIRVSRREDGTTVYAKHSPFRVGEKRVINTVEFSFRTDGGEPSLPVRFHHAGAVPPVWVKHG